MQFDREDSVAIAEYQDLLKNGRLTSDLAFIKCHLSFLPGAITRLEEAGLPLTQSLGILEEVRTKIYSVPGGFGSTLQAKLESVLSKNPGFEDLEKVSHTLSGLDSGLPAGMGPGEAAQLKYCPTASVDVERSFSVFKVILSDRRHNLTKENLSKIVVSNAFYNRK